MATILMPKIIITDDELHVFMDEKNITDKRKAYKELRRYLAIVCDGAMADFMDSAKENYRLSNHSGPWSRE